MRSADVPTLTSAMINMPWDDVSPANTMVGTRLTSMVNIPYSDGTSSYACMGTEAIISVLLSFNNYTGSNNEVEMESYSYASVMLGYPWTTAGDRPTLPSVTNITETELRTFADNVYTAAYHGINHIMTIMALREQFDWAPIAYVIPVKAGYDASSSAIAQVESYNISAVCADLNNWTIISSDDLAQMHLTAIMSEYNVPQIGSF